MIAFQSLSSSDGNSVLISLVISISVTVSTEGPAYSFSCQIHAVITELHPQL